MATRRKPGVRASTRAKGQPKAAPGASASAVRGLSASIRACAEEFGLDRDTLGRRITESGLKSVGQERGHPVYRWRDLHAAAFGTETDPDKLDPYRRKAHYQGEMEKLRLAQERGELIPKLEVEQEQARAMKVIARTFDTLPDIVERDCGASAAVLLRIETALDGARRELHRLLVAENA